MSNETRQQRVRDALASEDRRVRFSERRHVEYRYCRLRAFQVAVRPRCPVSAG